MTQQNPIHTEEEVQEVYLSSEQPNVDKPLKINARWGAILLTLVGVAFFIFSISVVTYTDPEDYILVGFPLVMTGLGATSIYLIQRDRIMLGSGIVFVLNLILPFLLTLFVADTFWAATLYTVVSSALLIWRTMPRSSWRWPIIAAIVGLVVISIVNIIDSPNRFDYPPQFTPFVITVITLLVLFFLAQAAQQLWLRSMRNKLIVSFIGITLVATVALGVPIVTESTRFLEENLEREYTTLVVNRATEVGDLLSEQVSVITTLSLNQILLQEVEADNQSYQGSASAIQAELDAKDAQWRAADAANNNNDLLVSEHLKNSIAYELVEFRQAFPNHTEVFITDVYGGLAGTTNRTSDYYQADEAWWQAAYNDGQGAIYISAPEFDESANAIGVQIALPLRDRATGEITGILRTTYLMSALGPILQQSIGETGSLDLLIPGETVSHYHEGILEEAEPVLLAELQEVRGPGMAELVYEGTLSVVTQAPIQTLEGNPAVDNLDWVVTFHQHRDEAFNQIQGQTEGVLYTGLIVLPLAALAAFGLSILLVRPISSLTQTAEEIAAGNLGSRAEVTTTDEIGTLASTFNTMTAQLQETLEGLEERVDARTRDLAIVAEVGTAAATIRESQRLLQEAVDLTKKRFDLYHSHIYLLDEKGENLVLAAGAGEPGRVMVAEGRSIPLDSERSLVARAARQRKGVTVNDVTQVPDHLPNPLLPDTRSELAAPMVVGGNLIGVFDIQSDQVGRFTDADINIQTTLAAQLAVSIQNVRSFERSRRDSELQSLVNVIGSRIQRTTSIEETLQTAIRELGTAIGASRVKASIKPASDVDLQTVVVEPAEPVLVTEVEGSAQPAEHDEDESNNQATVA